MKKLSRHNFDDLIRERFEGFEPSPPDHLKARIKQSVSMNTATGSSIGSYVGWNKWLLSGIVLVVASGIITLGILNSQSDEASVVAKNAELVNAIALNGEEIQMDEVVFIKDESEKKFESLIKKEESIILSQDKALKNSNEEIKEKVVAADEVEIEPKPDAGEDFAICGLECKLEAALSNENINGKWSYTGPGKISFSSKTNPKSKIEASKYGKYNLIWTETYKGLQRNDEIVVEFLKSGDITITSEVINASCHDANGSVELIVDGGDGNYNYYWNDEMFPSDSYRDNLSAGNYEIKVIDGNECQSSTVVSVEDKGIVKPSFVHKELTLSVDVPIYFINATKVDGISYENCNMVTFSWKFGDGHTSELAEPEHIYQLPGSYVIKLYATSSEGCKDSTYTIVLIDTENPQYVNIFTPNGDGINDIFYAKVKYLQDFKCVIVNRYGREIYKWNNPEEGWDGKLEDGSYAKSGTYYYLVTGKDQNDTPYNYQSFFMLSR